MGAAGCVLVAVQIASPVSARPKATSATLGAKEEKWRRRPPLRHNSDAAHFAWVWENFLQKSLRQFQATCGWSGESSATNPHRKSKPPGVGQENASAKESAPYFRSRVVWIGTSFLRQIPALTMIRLVWVGRLLGQIRSSILNCGGWRCLKQDKVAGPIAIPIALRTSQRVSARLGAKERGSWGVVPFLSTLPNLAIRFFLVLGTGIIDHTSPAGCHFQSRRLCCPHGNKRLPRYAREFKTPVHWALAAPQEHPKFPPLGGFSLSLSLSLVTCDKDCNSREDPLLGGAGLGEQRNEQKQEIAT